MKNQKPDDKKQSLYLDSSKQMSKDYTNYIEGTIGSNLSNPNVTSSLEEDCSPEVIMQPPEPMKNSQKMDFKLIMND